MLHSLRWFIIDILIFPWNIELPFQTIPNFTPNVTLTVQCKIDRNGDLMYDTYLVFDLPALFSNKEEPVGWSQNPGNDLIDNVEILCGGARLDIKYGMWMTIWNELTLADSKLKSYHDMVGNTLYSRYSGTRYLDQENTLVIPPKRLYIPLDFGFVVTWIGHSISFITIYRNIYKGKF